MENFAASVRQAEIALRDLFEPTPLQKNDHLSAKYGAEIWLKREDLTPVRSYKLRGAFNAMRKVAGGAARHFVCASAGNHAQGMAFACRHFGARGTIFMPVTTPRQKIDKTRIFGGDAVEIVLIGDYFDQTLTAAQEYAREQGASFLSPFDDADIIEGQATVGLELLDQLGGAPDLVLSDMAANTVGHPQTDALRTMALVETALAFAVDVLLPGGTFVAKVFAGGADAELVAEMKRNFATVKHAKPPASRKGSVEWFVVAQGRK